MLSAHQLWLSTSVVHVLNSTLRCMDPPGRCTCVINHIWLYPMTGMYQSYLVQACHCTAITWVAAAVLDAASCQNEAFSMFAPLRHTASHTRPPLNPSDMTCALWAFNLIHTVSNLDTTTTSSAHTVCIACIVFALHAV